MKIDFSAWLAVEPGNGQIVAIFRYKEDRDIFNEENGTMTPEENREMRANGGIPLQHLG